VSRAARRSRQLARLERVAELRARAARQRLATARAAEADTARAVAALDARRRSALAAPSADPAAAIALGAWLRWAEGERRRLTVEQAARRARAEALRDESTRVIARHAVIEKLLERARAGRTAPAR